MKEHQILSGGVSVGAETAGRQHEEEEELKERQTVQTECSSYLQHRNIFTSSITVETKQQKLHLKSSFRLAQVICVYLYLPCGAQCRQTSRLGLKLNVTH